MAFGPGTGKGAKRLDNRQEAYSAKVTIRESVLDAVAAAGPVHVFDAFGGTGQMFDAVWNRADSYCGCDLKYEPFRHDPRLMFAADNRRVLRAIDLSEFNVFDLDAFGSPWLQALIISERRKLQPGEVCGFCMTDGAAITAAGNNLPLALAQLAGLKAHMQAGASRWLEAIAGRAIHGMLRRMGGGEIVARWQAIGKSGYRMQYSAFVLKGAEIASPDAKGALPESAPEPA